MGSVRVAGQPQPFVLRRSTSIRCVDSTMAIACRSGRTVVRWHRSPLASPRAERENRISSAGKTGRYARLCPQRGAARHLLLEPTHLPSVRRLSRQSAHPLAKRVSLPTIRHTTAPHLLRSRVGLNMIRAWLGHVSLATTNVYAEVELKRKAKALETHDVGGAEARLPLKEDMGLMEFLHKLQELYVVPKWLDRWIDPKNRAGRHITDLATEW